MTKEEIIELVKQTDLLGIIDSQYYENELWIPDVVEFAKLVAEKERDACIKIVMQGTGEPVQRKTLDILHQERTRIALAIKGQE